MSRKALLAKISRPRLFNVTPRERLFALLDDNRGRPLIWISGPPGAGKTALVASYLGDREAPSIWYQIDAGDADPAAVFHYFALAGEAHSTSGLPSLPRFVPEHLSDLPGFARLFFRAFFSQLPERVILVLDNFQEAPEDASVHDILRQAVAEVPPGSSVIVISRVEAPSSFVQFAAQGVMTGVGWDKLQFALEEVRAIAAERGVTDDWLLKALHHQSQGWVAGITLMLERLGQFDGRSQELPTETRESVFNYFASLIFDRASEQHRHILLSIGFLPRVTPSFAIELSGCAGAPTLLEDLYRRRMFTDRRPGTEPVYQFHALFLDFLRSQAKVSWTAQQLTDLLHRSACLLEKVGELEAAMDIWLAAQEWSEVTRLIEKEGSRFLNSGRRQTLIRWINALPETQREKQPWTTFWLGRALMQTAPEQGIEVVERSLNSFRKLEDHDGQIECLAVLLKGGFLGFRAFEKMNGGLDELLALMEKSPGFRSQIAELEIRGVLATSLFHLRPWHPLTVVAYRRVGELLSRCTDPSVGLNASLAALVVSALSGDFDLGNRVADAAKSFASLDSASPSEAAWCLAQIGYLRFMEGRYDEALDILDKAARVAETNGVRSVLLPINLWRFTIQWRVVGWPAANATLAKVRAMTITKSAMNEAMLQLFSARSAMHAGNSEEAERLSTLSQQSAMRTESKLQGIIFSLSNIDIFLQIGKREEAQLLIGQVNQLIELAPVYRCFRAALSLVEARLVQTSEKRLYAVTKLREALAQAKEGNSRYYIRFADYSMPPLFCLALEEGIEVNLVQHIIRMFRLKPPDDAPDNWPRPVRIFTLGRFEVQVNDKPMEFSRKLPRKTLLLLKAIVAFGGRDVPEQSLCDALWGDEEGDAASNALAITVLRLRKLLGSSESVIQQGGKISLNPEMCWVDKWVFEARLADRGFDSQKVLASYGGTFLPEDGGESWSVAPRERLRGKFIDTLSQFGAILENEGNWSEAVRYYLRGIDADPIVESFHQGLMRCYERLDKRTEALSVYRRFKHTLSVVLGVPPSDATQGLFKEVLRRQTEDGALRESDADKPGQEVTGSPGHTGKPDVVVRLPEKRARKS
ncbi:MAG: BTAD domain-containing putative transcriptional regulator [Burkholderiales bacterium]